MIHVLGGGTFNHVRNHLALAAPAFCTTARRLANMLEVKARQTEDTWIFKHLTRMAGENNGPETNEDVDHIVESLIINPQTKAIFFNVALCDYKGSVDDVPGNRYGQRLKTSEGEQNIKITPAEKIISKIRKERKDIYVVGFKTTTGATPQQQYEVGLKLLKENSINLVLANDTVTRRNLIIVPEEAWYYGGSDREHALETLVNIFWARRNLTYTRSRVAEGATIEWNGPGIPKSLREVVNHCIKEGAYKPFLGKTAGHFAFKVNDTDFITSKRKTNFNELNKVGMVYVHAKDKDEVIAYGAKPSVGGQSQRIIFSEHSDVDCIVHFHCPPKLNIPFRDQWPYECGSHECGKNTSDGLTEVEPGIKMVYLDKHGPNIVFNRNVDPQKVINFIDRTFDLKDKTGGVFTSQ